MQFNDKAVLVSGAGSGIGRQAALEFSRHGARVALLGRSEDKLLETAGEIAAAEGAGTCVIPAHHEDAEDAAAAAARCVAEFGGIDVLVNNAGAYFQAPLADTPPEDWHRMMAANLTGPYVLTRACLPALREARGSIVNVSSSLGIHPVAGAAAYCTAKAGVNMLTRATALEEAAGGVRVNAVCPGVVETPIHKKRVGEDPRALRRFLDEMARLHPLGRVGTTSDVAGIILFLASEAAAWLTGAVIPVDGGISLT